MAAQQQGRALRKIIFDTDILVWYFRGNQKARSLIVNTLHLNRAISSLTLMELLQGCRNKTEIAATKTMLLANIPHLIHPTESISLRAVSLLEAHAASHSLRVVDALIAASALELGFALATASVKHYRALAGLELVVFRP